MLPLSCLSRGGQAPLQTSQRWAPDSSTLAQYPGHMLCSIQAPGASQPGETAAQVISQSGWTGLYRGLKPSLLGTTVSQGIYFYLYSILRQAAVKLEQRRGRGLNGGPLTST